MITLNRLRRGLDIKNEPKFLERVKINYFRRKIASKRRVARMGNRRLFIDVSVIYNHDAGTGIQRVVRSLALQRSIYEQAGWEVVFVSATKSNPYHAVSWPEKTRLPATTVPIVGGKGDVFLGLDYALDAVRYHEGQLRKLAQNGVQFQFLIHDLLPLNHPEWFPETTTLRFRKWLRILSSLADTIICNSSYTKSELERALSSHFRLTTLISSYVLPMGSDIQNHSLSTEVSTKVHAFISAMKNQPAFLCVGTIEPRKGHADLIEAMSILWDHGFDVNLILVGKKGWKVDVLAERIKRHREYGNKLIWFTDITDTEIVQFYKNARGIIVPSLDEGYGLPVIEALNYSKPVLARNIEVFRPHQNNGVHLFDTPIEALDLSRAILSWNNDIEHGRIDIQKKDYAYWKDSAYTLAKNLILPN